MSDHRRSGSFYADESPVVPQISVYEADEPQKTGLLDADGNPLIRPREPIGYIRRAQ